MATQALDPSARLIQDLRNSPVRGRDTQFRLAQQNILAYTYDAGIPGWTSSGLNSMSFREVVLQALGNANDEGRLWYGADYVVKANAVSKVTGDIYEIVTSAVLWETAAAWNRYMRGDAWRTSPRYARPQVTPSLNRQVAVLNLPRRYDWVKLLTPEAQERVREFRASLASNDLAMPTSTPDIAIVILPASEQQSPVWTADLGDLSLPSQRRLDDAHRTLEGKIEPGELILAIALKTSLRSDRLYQPLYEANVMEFLLERYLGAPRVEFEVHTLTAEGTGAAITYSAAALSSAGGDDPHRAIRELYVPANAGQVVQRFIGFLNERTALVAP
ncbi:Cfr10I/Bse634I family restriction endonuclease [Tessaracoccus defluvii]|uniref:Cfr10I/Bse634I family restriction endonuclease n=1 Tax=Tessaracoccus defluvii TaxID=1285901 RepID=A0A7H0H471_9ACTN|nr:Cfr10I/Bse634I family restriction endonuclease [Tessaracoccus defluvii]QNP55337.1 Cfr10I/Bse634I family restriction endonuclease [Tessaracoccus defluvii]